MVSSAITILLQPFSFSLVSLCLQYPVDLVEHVFFTALSHSPQSMAFFKYKNDDTAGSVLGISSPRPQKEFRSIHLPFLPYIPAEATGHNLGAGCQGKG